MIEKLLEKMNDANFFIGVMMIIVTIGVGLLSPN